MRKRRSRLVMALAVVLFPASAGVAHAQTLTIDTIPGRFDFGKMWTFEDAPAECGFYAGTLEAERRIPNYYTDQLIAIEDVSDAGHPDWALPARWLPVPDGLDAATPLNFVSTADTFGGNYGSPAITPGLGIVRINFDRNIEGLSRDFIYLPAQGRNIMVDVRAITTSLQHVYGADRIMAELSASPRPAAPAETGDGAGARAEAGMGANGRR